MMRMTSITYSPSSTENHTYTPSSSFTETKIDFPPTTMGKQSRRKRQRRKQNASAKEPGHGEATTSAAVPTSSSSTLIQRLRHADSRTRHAALVTVLAPLSEGKSAGAAVSISLMQAVRERVMDNDIECAQTAAECLGLYVTHQKHRETTASWTALLLNRIGRCLQEIQSRQQDNRTTTTASSSSSSVSMKRWWALTAKCLQALCGLIESNTLALERLTAPTPDGKNPVTVLGILVGHGTYVAP